MLVKTCRPEGRRYISVKRGALSHRLVFETHVGLGENADLGQTANRSTGQAEPTTKRYLGFCWHE